MSEQNGVSTPEECRAAAFAERVKRSQVVTMPSGLKVRLVKPTPWESFMQAGTLPQSVAAAILPDTSGNQISEAEGLQMARRANDFLRFIFVEPRVPDECKPGIGIPNSDIRYAVSWARGEVTDSGQNLAEFPDNRPGAATTPQT